MWCAKSAFDNRNIYAPFKSHQNLKASASIYLSIYPPAPRTTSPAGAPLSIPCFWPAIPVLVVYQPSSQSVTAAREKIPITRGTIRPFSTKRLAAASQNLYLGVPCAYRSNEENRSIVPIVLAGLPSARTF